MYALYFNIIRRIEMYLTDVERRTIEAEQIKQENKKEKDKTYNILVDNLISIMVNTYIIQFTRTMK